MVVRGEGMEPLDPHRAQLAMHLMIDCGRSPRNLRAPIDEMYVVLA